MELPAIFTLRLAVLAGISFITPAHAVVTTTDGFGSGGTAFTMDFVTIGNPGNTADTTGAPNAAGSVATTYRIGTYEVSRDMVSNANTDGALGITLAAMTSLGGNGANRTATGVFWDEVARFVNSLNVTRGSTTAYKFGTQPGDVGYGANFNLVQWASVDAGYDASNPFRNSNAKYFLPSENEWYKAAYYGSSRAYFNYPTGSDAFPTLVESGTVGVTTVYGSYAADITSAGGLSPYGTMGQGGNMAEWMETEFDGVNNSSGSYRGLRGSSSLNTSFTPRASERDLGDPTVGSFDVGFRVASVPETTGPVLTMLAEG